MLDAHDFNDCRIGKDPVDRNVVPIDHQFTKAGGQVRAIGATKLGTARKRQGLVAQLPGKAARPGRAVPADVSNDGAQVFPGFRPPLDSIWGSCFQVLALPTGRSAALGGQCGNVRFHLVHDLIVREIRPRVVDGFLNLSRQPF